MVGTSQQQKIPDMLTNSATATNVCGLEVSANKLCGDTYKMKKFDICGCVTVCEHECSSGCEGQRHCLDGRYSTTAQRYSALDDSGDLGDFDPQCEIAGGLAGDAGGVP